jgi:hypothetical protein
MDVVLDDRNVDLVQEGIDVGLHLGRLADSSLTAQRLVTGRRGVFGTTAYFARTGEPEAPGDLTAHEAVIYDQTPGSGRGGAVWTFQRDGTEVVVTLKGRLRVTAPPSSPTRVLRRHGMDVHARARGRYRQGGAARLGIARYRSLGGVPGRPVGYHQSTYLRELRPGNDA